MIRVIRNRLLKTEPYALDLLKALEDKKPVEFSAYLKKGCTIELMEICESFRGTSLYSHRCDKLPFDNDVYAIDSALLYARQKCH